MEFYNSAPLTASATSNRSYNTNPKADLIPVSCRWPFRLAAQISTCFSLFTHCPPLTLFPGSQCGGNPQLKSGLCSVEAARCGQDLSHYSQLHSGTRRGHLNTGCEGRVRARPNTRKEGHLCCGNRAQLQILDTLFPLKSSGSQLRVVSDCGSKCSSFPVRFWICFKKETAQWIRMLCWTTSTRTWILCRLKLRQSKTSFFLSFCWFNIKVEFHLLCLVLYAFMYL